VARARNRHFDRFGQHTQFKHLTLSQYLERWVRMLLLRPDGGDHVTLVDAFAGEGRDREGNDGSPVILARLAEAAEDQLRKLRPGRPIRIGVLALEHHAGRCARLREVTAPFGTRVRVLRGSRAQVVPRQ
jgi:three-Cys-motif partner protein